MVGTYHFDIDRLTQISLSDVETFDVVVVEADSSGPSLSNSGEPLAINLQNLSSRQQHRLISHLSCLTIDGVPIEGRLAAAVYANIDLVGTLVWLPCRTDLGAPLKDQQIVQAARSADIRVVALDTPEIRGKLEYDLSLDDQISLIQRALEMNMAQFQDDFLQAFQEGDVDELLAQARQTVPEAYFQAMIVERNIAWMPTLYQELLNDNTLVAVGAAHLGGQHGLVALLKREGFIVEPTSLPTK